MFIAFGFWEEDVCSGAWALQCREQTHFILFFFPLGMFWVKEKSPGSPLGSPLPRGVAGKACLLVWGKTSAALEAKMWLGQRDLTAGWRQLFRNLLER